MAATLCICGLAAEARIARAAGFSAIVGAGDRIRTAALVEGAVRRASCLVSFGIAGALSPELRSGDVVISTKVIAGGRIWRAPEPFASRVAGLGGRIGALEGAVLGAPGILATAAEKRRAWAETGALAVDLESDVVARIASAAGIPDGFTPHSLRHAYASAMLARGVQITELAHFLGHKDINTTHAVYGHLLPSAAKRAVSALNAEFAEWSKSQQAPQDVESVEADEKE